MPASFVIETKVGGARTVRILRDGCPEGDIGIDSRPLPPGQAREYFVTCGGKEPTGCRMLIQSLVPVVADAALPAGAGAIVMCRGDCKDPDFSACRMSDIQLDDTTALSFCGCVLRELKQVAVIEDDLRRDYYAEYK